MTTQRELEQQQLAGLLLKNSDCYKRFLQDENADVSLFDHDYQPILKAMDYYWQEHNCVLTRKAFIQWVDDNIAINKDKARCDRLFNECMFSKPNPNDYGLYLDGLKKNRQVTRLSNLVKALSKITLTDAERQQTIDTGRAYNDGKLNNPSELLARCDQLQAILDSKSDDPLHCLEDLNPCDIEQTVWLWPNRIAIGALSHLSGEVGVGKTSIALDIASHISTGRPWGDGKPCPQGKVILIMEEDNKTTSLIPRLVATGADHTKVKRLVMENFEADLAKLDAILADPRMSDTKMVVIDPIGNYLGDTNSDKDSAVRNVMRPLIRIAEQRQVAILTLGHFSKSKGGSLLNRCLGSKAFTGLPRSVLAAGSDGDGGYALIHVKSSDDERDEPLRYRLEPFTFTTPNGLTVTKARVVWDGVSSLSESELVAIVDGSDSKVSQATVWLRDLLSDGNARKSSEILAAGEKGGYSKATLWRAAERLKVNKGKVGFGGEWLWKLD